MSKIYIEGRFKMPVIDTDEFGYDKEEAEKIDWEEFAKEEFWNSCENMGELEDKYDITFHESKIRIPKKVASIFEDLEFDWLHLMFGDYDLDDLSQKEIRLLVKHFGGYEDDFRDYFTEKFMKYFLLYKISKELELGLFEIVEDAS